MAIFPLMKATLSPNYSIDVQENCCKLKLFLKLFKIGLAREESNLQISTKAFESFFSKPIVKILS